MANSAVQSTTKVKWWGGYISPFNVEYGKLMMWFLLISDSLTFGGLLISYGTIRMGTPNWPDPNKVFDEFPGLGPGHPLMFVSLMTFILIISSVTMVLAVQAGKEHNKAAVARYMLFTIIGGLMFLGCQAIEWTHLHSIGAWWGHNPFPNADGSIASPNFTNFFFTITGFHGLHVFSGILINIIILINVLCNTYEKRGSYLMVEKVGLYWHFVDLVWVFVFTCFYLI